MGNSRDRKTIITQNSVELAEHPCARALAEIWRAKASGVLELSNQNVNKTIFLREGVPVRVSSNIAEELLGRFLVNRGEIDEATSLAALTKSVETDRYLGEVLVEMGALTPHALFTALRRCLGMRILDAFRWESGSMSYKPGAPNPDDGMDLEIPPVPLVLKGVASFLSYDVMQRDLPLDDNRLFQVIAERIDALRRPSPTQLRMLRSMGEPTTLSGLVEAAHVTEEEAFRFAYALSILEIVGSPEEAAASREAAEAKAETEQASTATSRAAAPEPPSSRTLTDTEKQLIDGMYMAAKSKNFFELLEVEEKPMFSQIRAAFLAACGQVSPMTFAGVDLGERSEQVEEIFLILVRAFSTLSEADRREQYLRQLKSRTSRREKRQRRKTVENPFQIKTDLLDVDVHLQNGVNILRARNSGQALQHFEFALNIQPENPQALAYYGYCLFVVDSLDSAKAVEHIERSIQLAPDESLGYFMLGRVLEACNNYTEAQRAYSRCLRIEPGHQQAQGGQARLRKKLAGR